MDNTGLTNEQWYALGIIAGGSCYHRERSVYVLQVRRTNRRLLEICQEAFGGKIYSPRTRPCIWVLRGKPLKVFLELLEHLPLGYPSI